MFYTLVVVVWFSLAGLHGHEASSFILKYYFNDMQKKSMQKKVKECIKLAKFQKSCELNIQGTV